MLRNHLSSLFVCWVLVFGAGSATAASSSGVIEKAKAEGELSFYTSMNIGESKPLLDAFEQKYPFIKAKLTRVGGTAIATRMLTEARAGRHLWDVSAPTLLYAREVMKKGLVAPYASPERRYYRKEFKDKKNLWTGIVLNTSVMVYNTQMLKPSEYPRNYNDLLKPRFKGGRISMDTELYLWFAGQLRIRGKEKGMAFMRKLKAQDPVFRRGRTAQAQAVIAGEMLVAVEVYGHRAQAFKGAGAPLDWVAVEPVLTLPLAIMLNKRARHPNAARLFIDFALSKGGQELLRDKGRIPARSDVTINPPELLKKDWRIEVIGLEENLTELVKRYSTTFGLAK
ncbi:MAG: ABC transporter substrate-binding protein [Candidatus Binatia bacterium]